MTGEFLPEGLVHGMQGLAGSSPTPPTSPNQKSVTLLWQMSQRTPIMMRMMMSLSGVVRARMITGLVFPFVSLFPPWLFYDSALSSFVCHGSSGCWVDVKLCLPLSPMALLNAGLRLFCFVHPFLPWSHGSSSLTLKPNVETLLALIRILGIAGLSPF